MKNWIIKLLGGYTAKEYMDVYIANAQFASDLRHSRKNDTPHDPKTGRFVKK